MEFDDKYYEEKFKDDFRKQKVDFDSLKNSKLVISLVGNVNSGKSATINALTGKELAEVKAKSGWTKEVNLYQYQTNVFIADTPGLKDINQDVSKRAEEFIEKDTDIILFFINAAVSITDDEKKAIESFKKLNKPIIIVLNKIDIWYDSETKSWDNEEWRDVVDQIIEETDISPISISAKKQIRIELLHRKIVEILSESGKDLLFLKIAKLKEEDVKIWINAATLTAAGIGAIPIPISDIIALTSLQVGLALRISYIYNCKVTENDALQLISATVTGNVGRTIFRWGVSALKGLGWIGGPLTEAPMMALAALVAASTTYGFGWAANAYYKSGMTIDFGSVGQIFKEQYSAYRTRNEGSSAL